MTTIFTIGHGNRAIEEFVALLRQSRIEHLVDVRAFPASRRNPQFAREALERALAHAGIHYLWEGEGLGGRRRPAARSPHTALRNAGFRAYADHMMQTEFQAALDRLIGLGKARRAAVMCAERLPWHCHRHLISDSLVARDIPVMHIISPEQTLLHGFSKFARVDGRVLIYDAGMQADLGLPLQP
jgi:uncharacterized protein (DUF488 family)